MALLFILVMTLAVFAVQLVLCSRARQLWIKLLPLLAVTAADVFCWTIYFGGFWSEVYGAAFAAYIYGVVLAAVLGVDVLAWATYGVWELLHSRKEDKS